MRIEYEGRTIMKTNFGACIAALAFAIATISIMLAASPAAFAGKSKTASQHYHGKVTAVDATAGTITIHLHKQGDMTFAVTSSTKVLVAKAPSTLAAVPVGDVARIESADGKTAISIHAHEKVVKTKVKGDKAAASPAPL